MRLLLIRQLLAAPVCRCNSCNDLRKMLVAMRASHGELCKCDNGKGLVIERPRMGFQ